MNKHLEKFISKYLKAALDQTFFQTPFKTPKTKYEFALDNFGAKKLRIEFDYFRKDIQIWFDSQRVFSCKNFQLFYYPRTLILSNDAVLKLLYTIEPKKSYWTIELDGKKLELSSRHVFKTCCAGIFMYGILMTVVGIIACKQDWQDLRELGFSPHSLGFGLVSIISPWILSKSQSLKFLYWFLSSLALEAVWSQVVIPIYLPWWLRALMLMWRLAIISIIYREGVVSLESIHEEKALVGTTPEAYLKEKPKDLIVGEWKLENNPALTDQYHIIITQNGFFITSHSHEDLDTLIFRYSLEANDTVYLYDQDFNKIGTWEYQFGFGKLILKNEDSTGTYYRVKSDSLRTLAFLTEDSFKDSRIYPSFKTNAELIRKFGSQDISLN
jgi:hypothetical protein